MKLSPLPTAPDALTGPVKAWSAAMTLPSYDPATPDKNPMFLENRVFQGSSGRVYPLPFYDRINQQLVDKQWQALHIENDFLRVTILPELGGRIYAMIDKINDYDVIYRNRVIKPALVGLAGPWLSGGIEFNWPQHHRPSTYMACSWTIEEEADGARTIWLSEHEPMTRMKGMHGVRLTAASSVLELRVRLHNRTELTQTFLWWANVANDVSEHYQSFFPEDVRYIADHAKRAMSAFPYCEGHYYGIDYAKRARDGVPEAERPRQFSPLASSAPNDLRWYANIPVPTSYMCLGSKQDFFGGYDHGVAAGMVHIADHHISPGKKQWTWGNQEFGYAWDRNLTEADEDGVYHPYIELMAGVFTDNQPDFSYLAPGETKSFSQFWYPIREIGPAIAATRQAAIGLSFSGTSLRIGVHVTRAIDQATLSATVEGKELACHTTDLLPAQPFHYEIAHFESADIGAIGICVTDADGAVIVERVPADASEIDIPPAASEPPAPDQIESADELFTTGMHLAQYRHATRSPVPYWTEALKRDPLDSRCNIALGSWHLRRAELDKAKACYQKAIARQTLRNPNPSDGEAYYYLGITLRYLGEEAAAYDALSKSAWNHAWQGAAQHALAEMDARQKRWPSALCHIEEALRHDVENLSARNLYAEILFALERHTDAHKVIEQTIEIDPLDPWALLLHGNAIEGDDQLYIDVAIMNARAGLIHKAFDLLVARAKAVAHAASPMLHYYAASYARQFGDTALAKRHGLLAANACSDYCFPARIEDAIVLREAIAVDAQDARAPYYLGNLLYDRQRHEEAILLWEDAARLDAAFSIVWRNLGIGYFNIRRDADAAMNAFDKALIAAPEDARIVYERDQLWKRIGRVPAERIAELEAYPLQVKARDDLSIELAALLNQLGAFDRAEALILSRQFQPWEGGEGMVLDQWGRTKLALARAALAEHRPEQAISHIQAALNPPHSLGEARHLLANQSELHYWLGKAFEAAGDREHATQHYEMAANSIGDFLGMEVKAFSEKTYYSAMALMQLGRTHEATSLLEALRTYAEQQMVTPAKIDYFATSLPTMLIFEDDLQLRRQIDAHVMLGEAAFGLGDLTKARQHMHAALELDPNHPLAADFLGEIKQIAC